MPGSTARGSPRQPEPYGFLQLRQVIADVGARLTFTVRAARLRFPVSTMSMNRADD